MERDVFSELVAHTAIYGESRDSAWSLAVCSPSPLTPGRCCVPPYTNDPALPWRDPDIDYDEGPLVVTRLDPFFCSKYELTQRQYERVMHSNPSRIVGPLHPVDSLSGFEAMESLRRLALSLPTEAQYEYCARAGSTTAYPTGVDGLSIEGAANFADSSYAAAGESNGLPPFTAIDDGHVVHAPVGSYAANAFGLHDTLGNVWSWCLDDFGYERELREGDGLNGSFDGLEDGALRGGGWHSPPEDLRSANRMLYGRSGREPDVGIQPVRKLD